MNEYIMNFLGITEFHKAGIKGQGITVASIENGKTTHSKMVLDVLHQILPEATILTSIKYWRDDEIPLNLDGYTCSLEYSDSDDAEKVKKQKELYDKGVFMTCSIGNDDTKSYSKFAKYDEWASIGACRLYSDNTICPEHYSSVSPHIDFMGITNWDTPNGFFNGSSCATPVVQGMAMLVQCYFLQKYKTKLSNKELYEFIKRHCIDIGKAGFDTKCGYGVFVLPSVNEIEAGMMKILLKIGDKKAKINGKEVELDVAPKIENNRTLVPIRFISEAFGYKVDWNEKTKEITISN